MAKQSPFRNVHEYEHAFTAWAKAKREFKLCADDVEPDAQRYGLGEWEASQIKKRIEKELDRKF